MNYYHMPGDVGHQLQYTCLQAKTVAEQLAAKLNTKLNYQPKEEDDKAEEEQVETFRKYEEELEINDFPQQARWRVTSKVRTMS
jgi:ATP-dependent RNA helicase DDX46/PRP5